MDMTNRDNLLVKNIDLIDFYQKLFKTTSKKNNIVNIEEYQMAMPLTGLFSLLKLNPETNSYKSFDISYPQKPNLEIFDKNLEDSLNDEELSSILYAKFQNASYTVNLNCILQEIIERYPQYMLTIEGNKTKLLSYLKEKWLKWMEEMQLFSIKSATYLKLKEICNTYSKNNRNLEIVIAYGLIKYKETRSHIMTIKAQLSIDDISFNDTIRLSVSDTSDFKLEGELIPKEVGITNDLLISFKQNKTTFISDGINEDKIKAFIEQYSASCKSPKLKLVDATYESNIKDCDYGVISLSPYIILRNKSEEHAIDFLEKLKTKIKNTPVTSSKLDTISKELTTTEVTESDNSTKNSVLVTDEANTKITPHVYFPLPYSDEQASILNKLEKYDIAVIKGYSGTGKSQTACNLISHTLATGKRVLITSKTNQSLKNIHQKLPREIRDLCFNITYNDPVKQKNSVFSSIDSIVGKIDQKLSYSEQIEESLQNYHHNEKKLRVQIDKIDRLAKQEREIYSPISGKYEGNIAQIVQKIKEKEEQLPEIFNSDKDEVKYLPKIEESYVEKIIQLMQNNSTDDELELIDVAEGYLSNFPSPEELKNIIIEEDRLKEALKKNRTEEKIFNDKLDYMSDEKLENVIESINGILQQTSDKNNDDEQQELRKYFTSLLLDGNSTSLKTIKLHIEKKVIPHLESINDLVITINDEYGSRLKLVQVAVEELLEHYRSGEKDGLLFKKEVIKKNKFIYEAIKVNDLPCNKNHLSKLQSYLIAISNFRNIEAFAKHDFRFDFNDSVEHCTNKLSTICKVADDIINLDSSVNEIGKLLKEYNIQYLNIDVIKITSNELKNIQMTRKLNKLADSVSPDNFKFTTNTRQKKAYFIESNLRDSMKYRDISRYKDLYKRSRLLLEKIGELSQLYKFYKMLCEVAPNFLKKILTNNDRMQQVDIVKYVIDYLQWCYVCWYINSKCSDNINNVKNNIVKLRKEKQTYTRNISSMMAWENFISNISYKDKSRLQITKDKIQRVNQAEKRNNYVHQNNTQDYLRLLQTAVPAWIMPIDKVFELTNVDEAKFDLIIIDNASQCYPHEIFPLMALTQKLLIIGDEKQIVIDNQLDKNKVKELKSQFSSIENELINSFDVEKTLLDVAIERFQNNTITLRDHFRCPADIINFSNELCYDNKLIPIKAPTNIVDPLKYVFVNNTFISENGINYKEASILVEKLLLCHRDRRYDGMTFGIISLLNSGKQRDCIIQLLKKHLTEEEIQIRKIICGSSEDFQGDECDVIFISMVETEYHDNHDTTVVTNIINNAFSRARQQIWLFSSLNANDFRNKECIEYKLIKYVVITQNQTKPFLHSSSEKFLDLLYAKKNQDSGKINIKYFGFDNWFEFDLILEILKQGYHILPRYKIESNEIIDFIITDSNNSLAIICENSTWKSDFEEWKRNFERFIFLEEIGWNFARIAISSYYMNKDFELQKISMILNKLKISTFNIVE